MRRLLVVVDYQNDFVSGALGFEGADRIEERIVSLIDEFHSRGDMVCFTLDTHQANYLKTVEGKNLPIPHCIKGTNGWKLTNKVNEKVNWQPTFEKTSFGSIDLGNFIRGNQFDEIYLCGLVSDICVFSNAIIAKASGTPNTRVIVLKDATDSNDKDMQEKSFEMLRHLHIEVI